MARKTQRPQISLDECKNIAVSYYNRSKRKPTIQIDTLLLILEEWMTTDKTLVELSEKYNVSMHAVRRFLKNSGILQTGKYSNNNRTTQENLKLFEYLSNIDTIEKAYVLGILVVRSSFSGDTILFNTSVKNKSVIERISKYIGKIGARIKYNTYTTNMDKQIITCRINSKHVADLIKTYINNFDLNSKELNRYLIRGIYDIAGFMDKKYYVISVKSDNIAKQIQDILKNYFNINSVIKEKGRRYHVRINTSEDAEKFKKEILSVNVV